MRISTFDAQIASTMSPASRLHLARRNKDERVGVQQAAQVRRAEPGQWLHAVRGDLRRVIRRAIVACRQRFRQSQSLARRAGVHMACQHPKCRPHEEFRNRRTRSPDCPAARRRGVAAGAEEERLARLHANFVNCDSTPSASSTSGTKSNLPTETPPASTSTFDN